MVYTQELVIVLYIQLEKLEIILEFVTTVTAASKSFVSPITAPVYILSCQSNLPSLWKTNVVINSYFKGQQKRLLKISNPAKLIRACVAVFKISVHPKTLQKLKIPLEFNLNSETNKNKFQKSNPSKVFS